MSVDPKIDVLEASTTEQMDRARALFRAYAAEFHETIAEALCLQGFEAEVANLPGRYASPTGRLLLAMDGDRPVGCVGLRDLGGRACEMKRLFVHREYRGHQVGRRLVEGIIERAGQAGYARIRLDTAPVMTNAQSLYRSIGFRPIPRYVDDSYHGAAYFELELLPSEAIDR